ncbi:MAG TPA: phosphoribosylamine--glycine ligase family protein, partial [Nocardioides sp.]|nr:phosphoribosylamine--glycine ligase family protein [Nocardioides sp.]
MKTLVIGTGGREHALALALSQDPAVTEVHAAPGNPGLATVATLHDVDPMSGSAVAELAACQRDLLGLAVDIDHAQDRLQADW